MQVEGIAFPLEHSSIPTNQIAFVPMSPWGFYCATIHLKLSKWEKILFIFNVLLRSFHALWLLNSTNQPIKSFSNPVWKQSFLWLWNEMNFHFSFTGVIFKMKCWRICEEIHLTLPCPHGLQILIGLRCRRRGTWGDHWSRWFVGNCLPVRTPPRWTAGLPAPLLQEGKPAGGTEHFSCWQINALPSWL